MKTEDLVGTFCRVPRSPHRVLIRQILPAEGAVPERIFGEYIEGPDQGLPTQCYVHWIVPLEVPISEA
jgi:hypothetical protein